ALSFEVIAAVPFLPPDVIPAKAGTQLATCARGEVGPAFAGMTPSTTPAISAPSSPRPSGERVAAQRPGEGKSAPTFERTTYRPSFPSTRAKNPFACSHNPAFHRSSWSAPSTTHIWSLVFASS